MKKSLSDLLRRWLASVFSLVVLASWAPFAGAAPVDRSDLNNDNIVDNRDLEIFSNTYLGQEIQAVQWCNFYESSISNRRYFRKVISDQPERFKDLLNFIANSYYCQATAQAADKSDLNNDSIVDLLDLDIFSTNFLEMQWESVDWCLFHESTLAGSEFEGRSTKYFLKHFGLLLSFINDHFNCGGSEPPPNALLLENVPIYPGRVADATYFTGGYYITDPIVGSLFIYDADLVLTGEIKGLNRPLGVAIDSQGNILIGNDGRDNIEVYDPANGDLLAVFGEDLVNMPTAITIDNLGNIYVTDSLNHYIHVFDPAYNLVKKIGRFGAGVSELNFPTDAEIIAVSGGGANPQEIFIADQGNNRIQVYDLDGNWLRSFTFEGIEGQNCNWFTGVCAIPAVPGFQRVQALDTDSFGRLHVVDKFGASVAIFDPANGAFQGSYGSYGTDAGLLRVPIDVLISAADMAIVTAGDGDRVEVFAIP